MNYTDVPIREKYNLTIEKAAKYFRIGEKKLHQLADEHPNAVRRHNKMRAFTTAVLLLN